ncbi:MAG: ATP-dependent Clp protease ATP-binding subunit [Alloprevotella sp.]
MDKNWTKDFENILIVCRFITRNLGLSEITAKELFMALAYTPGHVQDLLVHLGLNLSAMKNNATFALPEIDLSGKFYLGLDAESTEISLSPEGVRILRLAKLEARRLSSIDVEPQHVLLSLLHDRNNVAARYLQEQGITLRKVLDYMKVTPAIKASYGLSDDEPAPPASGQNPNNARQAKAPEQDSDTPMLDNFGTDLTAKASAHLLDPIVGRERETLRMAQILCRRKKNNPILIGQPGVGKSAVVEGLAQLIADKKAPHILLGKRIVALDMAAVVAGTQYRGQFEDRIKKLINELKEHSEIVLFIDEIHTIIGAGSAAGSLDAANILKPALARGEVQCIGATTIDEYRKSIEKDGALERRFQKVMLEPSTAEETLEILKNLKSRYEEHHTVRYTDEALEACVRLTERYVTDRCLPDKAIDALDEAGSRTHLNSGDVPQAIRDKEAEIEALKNHKIEAAKKQDYELAARLRDAVKMIEQELEEMNRQWDEQAAKEAATVTADDVAEVVSIMTGVPSGKMNLDETRRLQQMKSALQARVIGQDEAVTDLVRAISANRLGIKGTDRPIGTFMFVGPTGVGKTHLVKCLAEYLFDRKDALIRVDMSEYGEKYSTSRLVGAPPGYVGYEEGGQLTERVRRHPYSVILLDEIEKAHPDVFNTLLQVMDEGRMTDGNGTTVDFRNTVIVMTSNSGSRQLEAFGGGVGFNAGESQTDLGESIIIKALKKQFAPEFLNRLDSIIRFKPLSKESARQIVHLEMDALCKRMAAQGYEIVVDDTLTDFLVAHGFEAQYGARSLKRAIKHHVEDLLCDAMLEGRLQQGEVRFDVVDDRLTLSPQS